MREVREVFGVTRLNLGNGGAGAQREGAELLGS